MKQIKQIMIDSSTMSKLTFILKKVRRFLQYKMDEKNDWCAHYKQKKQRKYIDSYNRKKKKKFDVHTINKKKVKKVHKFLQYGRKKMINMHVVKKKAKKVNKKNKNSINQSSQLLVASDSYFVCGIYSPIHIMPKGPFGMCV